ncbi:MAG: hypothetical protein ACRC20_13580 [Segniliparus sp.]|uniref:hypothetical protein n=1 Tax=Segniliparus sp. TaxID=2804064 RepID=UPI003F2A75EF
MRRAYRAYIKPEPETPAGLRRPVVVSLIAVAAVAAVLSVSGAVWLAARGAAGGPSPGAAPTRAAPPPLTATGPPARVLKLRDHPLLNDRGLALHGTTCRLPGWKPTAADEQAFMKAAVGCMNATWRPVLEAANLPFADASLAVHYGAGYGTACVPELSSASLCDDSIHILYAQPGSPALNPDPGSSLGLVSGWYGEYVQALSGITAAYRNARANVPENSPQRGEFGRRHTLQWQCFSGSFIAAELGLGSITTDMFDQALASTSSYGDDAGGSSINASTESHRRWFRRGADAKSLVDCNTWAASAPEVA